MKKKLVVLSLILLGGCASTSPDKIRIEVNSIEPITYNYTGLKVDKDTLFVRARDHFATIYGDSKSVIRVQDPKEGIILGKGAVDWKLATNSWLIPFVNCTSNYNVRFIAKDNKARLQLELIKGVPVYSPCSGWPLPTVTAYEEIKAYFDNISIGVESALKGTGSVESFKDF